MSDILREKYSRFMVFAEFAAEHERLWNWRDLWMRLSNRDSKVYPPKGNSGARRSPNAKFLATLQTRDEAVQRRAQIKNNQVGLLIEAIDRWRIESGCDCQSSEGCTHKRGGGLNKVSEKPINELTIRKTSANCSGCRFLGESVYSHCVNCQKTVLQNAILSASVDLSRFQHSLKEASAADYQWYKDGFECLADRVGFGDCLSLLGGKNQSYLFQRVVERLQENIEKNDVKAAQRWVTHYEWQMDEYKNKLANLI